MHLPLSLLTLLFLIHIPSSQRPYDEADCNGNQIYSFQSDQNSGKVDIIFNPTDDTPIIGESQFNIVNPPVGATSDIPGFESTAIDPTTGIIYTIVLVPGLEYRYLATVDISGDITIINEITPQTDIITGMTFDCEGILYVIKSEPISFPSTFGVFQMDTNTAEHVLFDTFDSNCHPPGSFGDCDELIGYNWDDGLLYRLSSDFTEGIKLFRINEDGTKIDVTVSDPNGYCLGAGSVFAMEYVGEDLWLISCDSGHGVIHLLDTSDITNPIIGPIGTDGIVFVSTSDRSASGLIGTTPANEFCVAICPTPLPTTSMPTTAMPTTTPTTLIPTTTPATTTTTATTTTACVLCPFTVELDEISPLLLSSDCPTPIPTPTPTPKPVTAKTKWKTKWNKESDSSDSDSSSDSSDRRRRMRKYDVYISSDSDDGDDICLINGDSLVFVDSLCVENGWDHDYADSSDNNVLTDAFLAPICVTYSIEDLVDTTDCGDINSIFLGLCTSSDTDFDVSLLGTGDIDNVLDTAAHDNILSAIGYRNDDGELGVQVTVQDPALSFTLCFVNVAVTATFNDTRYDLDIAQNGAIIYTDNAGDVITCTVLGLPCLNFFFGCEDDLIGPESGALSIIYGIANAYTKRNCDCEGGLTSLILMYDGEETAQSIIGYDSRNGILCRFGDVTNGESITCTAENTKRGVFMRRVIFSVTYNDREDECIGKVWTRCRHQIVGDTLKGCDDLIVISHIDSEGTLCDTEILALETGVANAFINDQKASYKNPMTVLDELDPYIKWTLICVMITFFVLVFVSIYICFIHNIERRKEEEDDVLKTIEGKKDTDTVMDNILPKEDDEETQINDNESANEQTSRTSCDLNVGHDYFDDDNEPLK